MGNRFRDLPQYHTLIKGHGILAGITFLGVVPAAILIARFHRSPWALRYHIYLQVLTVALSTVLFVLGFMAVGPERSLTNPHHGIGVAIYVIIMVQAIGGGLIHKRGERGRTKIKPSIKRVLHQWLGRALALLGIAQVPLGLVLYGSPKYLFILYAVWMALLLLLYFILSYRAMGPMMTMGNHSEMMYSQHGGTVIEDKKKSRFAMLGPLAAGAGVAALLGRKRRASRSRSRSRSRERRHEAIGSRRSSGSGSFIEEKYEKKESGGVMSKLFKGAAIAGGGLAAKSWWSKRQARRDDESDYSSVAQTPSRKPGRHGRHGSVYTTEETTVHRMEEGRPPMTPSGPGGPLMAATAISAAESPITPRPAAAHRRDSFDSDSYYNSVLSPSRRPQSNHGAKKGILATIGLGWIAMKMRDRKNRKEDERLDREDERLEQERLSRIGGTPSRLTGDGHAPPPRRQQHLRRDSSSYDSSDLSSIVTENRHEIRPGAIPLPPVSYGGGPVPTNQTTTQQETIISMPPAPPDPHGVLHQDTANESGSENYMSAGGHPHRRHSSRRRREGEAAAALATATAASLAAEEAERRRRSRSRSHSRPADVVSPPVSVKVKVHGDRNQNVTLRRLTEEEAAAERESRRTERRRRRADSLSSISGTDTASRRRYRRGEREDSIISGPPPAMAPLSPPNPAFAKGRRPKDSAYYSGRPGGPGGSTNTIGGFPPAGSVGSPESHGTWSAMSPPVSGGENNDERRRRRRAERSGGQGSRVEFT